MQREVTGFPSDFVSKNEKQDPRYGLAYAKSIFANFMGKNTQFAQTQRRYQECRKYAEGLHSIDKFKDWAGMRDTVYANMDWTQIAVIPVFIDLMVGEMLNQEFKIVASAIDPISATEKDKEKARLITRMKLKEFSDYVKQETGITVFKSNDYIPGSMDEIDLHMEMNHKLSTEVAIEEFVKYVFKQNKEKEVKRKCYRDMLVLKKGVSKAFINEHDDIEIRYVDPMNFITSYSMKDDFSDIRFAAEIINIDITELRRQSLGSLSEEDLFEIAKTHAGKNTNPSWNFGNNYQSYYNEYGHNFMGYDNFLIPVLDFQFISTNFETYLEKPNKYGGMYFEKKSNDYKTDDPNKKVHQKQIDYKYGGYWVVDTDYIYDYGMKYDNIRKKKSGVYQGETELDYVIYSPNHYEQENKSLVERMIPHADAIQRASLKLQHLVMKLKPDGIAVDVGAMHDIMLGKMVESTPLEITDFYEQTGIYFYNSKDEDGNYANRPPIQEIKQSIGPGLQQLIAVYNFERQNLRDITGVNEARDGISVKEDVAFKTQQMSLQASRNSTQELVDGFVYIYTKLAEKTACYISDLIVQNRMDSYKNIIGQLSVDVLKMNKEFRLSEFGIYLESFPSESEKALVEQNIQQALNKELIKLEDAIRVRELMKTSIKQANKYLALKSKQYQKERMAEQQALIQSNAEVQQMSNQQAHEAKIQEMQMELEALKLKSQLENQNNYNKHLWKMEELKLQGRIESAHIEQASDEDFKNTALTNAVKQPQVFTGKTM